MTGLLIVALCIAFVAGTAPWVQVFRLTRKLRNVIQERDELKRQRRAEMYAADRTSWPRTDTPPARITQAKPATEPEVKFDYGN